jgi:hypothetical protein
LEADLIVLGSKGERLAIDMVKHGAGFFHPVFSSSSRLAAFTADALPHFSLTGRALFEATRGAPFILNPRSVPAKLLLPDEIAWILDNFRFVDLAVVKPKSYPTRIVKALCVLFASRTRLQTARISYVAPPGEAARFVVGIEAEGDIPNLANEIFAVAAAADPAQPVDVVHLSPLRAGHPLQKHLLSLEPFFKRHAFAH